MRLALIGHLLAQLLHAGVLVVGGEGGGPVLLPRGVDVEYGKTRGQLLRCLTCVRIQYQYVEPRTRNGFLQNLIIQYV